VKDLEHRGAGLRVGLHARRHDERVRAQLSSLASAHRGAHAVGLGFVACREHDATADDDRTAAQRGVITLLNRGVEGVEIGVQDGRFRHEHMFAPAGDN
jgi:hypothetical protein